MSWKHDILAQWVDGLATPVGSSERTDGRQNAAALRELLFLVQMNYLMRPPGVLRRPEVPLYYVLSNRCPNKINSSMLIRIESQLLTYLKDQQNGNILGAQPDFKSVN